MQVEETELEGCYVITPRVFQDKRGEFFESFNQDKFEQLTGVNPNFVQDNQSISHKNVLRGLHFQIGDYAQAKLVRVISGSVLDVVVDIRPNSKTFGKYITLVLDDKTNKQLYIPRGMAHGFLSLEDNTIFSYKCDNYYNKASERGIIFNDESIGIDWNEDDASLIVSEKDLILPTLEEYFHEDSISHGR
ncbi:MAG: dTDP-4-dehydrorhamnose 3,5-epimerase [Winogradskyella sp.]